MSTLPLVDARSAPHGDGAAVSERGGAPFAICLPSMPSGDLANMVGALGRMFADEPLVVASPDQAEEQEVQEHGGHRMWLVPYPEPRAESEWVLDAAEYAAAARLADQRGASGVLLLGTEANTLAPAALAGMRQALRAGVDLAVPRYAMGPEDGLVNSALLYPLTRALFGVDVRFPLPLDAALSGRMLTRLASAAARSGPQMEEGLVWPVAEASIAGYSVRQSEIAERALPRPQEADLNILFPAVTSSLFTDIESKATFWQRARSLPIPRPLMLGTGAPTTDSIEEIRPLVEGFRLAFSNLREIWSLILPPQSLLALKKLSGAPVETFAFPPSLWARTVYDFALAFHLRTLNRGHLLGAMTPLYLAWVAGWIRETSGAVSSEGALESTASAFEQEKPYLVSRWRWPDRFNP